jgi:Transglycosylase SLT domain/Peptidase family M23
MKRRVFTLMLAAGLLAAAAFTVLTFPASAQTQTVYVQLATGEVVPVQVDVPPGSTLDDIQLPGTQVTAPTVPETTTPTTPTAPTPPPTTAPEPTGGTDGGSSGPTSGGGSPQERTSSGERIRDRTGPVPDLGGGVKARSKHEAERAKRRGRRSPLRNLDGTPTPDNPGFTDVLPGPSTATGVPNFIIRKFRVPPFLLPIYQAAGIEYGIRWEVLAAINEIETDYGRNLNVSSAGALGWMQFMPSTWQMYGTDANKDGRKDPYNPVDAIFAAARYLKAAGYEQDVRRAIFAYNHADWYVDSVLLRARLIAGVPADVIGSLTGLTEGRFPVFARARYADDIAEQELLKRVKRGENAAHVVESDDARRSIDIFAKQGAPVVAVNDGVIKKIGKSRKLGRYVMLQDVYGNRYTYAHLGEVSKVYPVPKRDADPSDGKRSATALAANPADPKPVAPASAGRQLDSSDTQKAKDRGGDVPADKTQASAPVKERLFAHPDMAGSREAGGLEQQLDAQMRNSGKYSTFKAYFSRPFGLDPSKVRLRPLRKGSHVIGGTILGRIGRTVPGMAPHLDFAIRPAGRGAPNIDPKPILDGWKLLEATAIYRASGRNVLYGKDGVGAMSIGQILLLPKPLLEKRVLSDERIEIYECGRDDIRSGQIDRRVLATLEYLAESGLRPTVTSLKCGHGFYTSSGNVSEHSSGNAVDIAMVNGIPILGHQEPGGITEQTVRRLMQLQGTMQPHQIISLLELGGSTFAMADHNDHIHVGFQPMFGANKKLGKQALAVLEPGQWSDLISRLGEIENPVVPTKPSKYALPAHKKRASKAHMGE